MREIELVEPLLENLLVLLDFHYEISFDRVVGLFCCKLESIDGFPIPLGALYDGFEVAEGEGIMVD
jgi:hypothetical protein